MNDAWQDFLAGVNEGIPIIVRRETERNNWQLTFFTTEKTLMIMDDAGGKELVIQASDILSEAGYRFTPTDRPTTVVFSKEAELDKSVHEFLGTLS